jgi:HEPN domain-containing protein
MSPQQAIEAAKAEIRGYLKSSRLLMVVTETDTDVIRTLIMILSFGVEKSLKALRRHVDEEAPSRGHNLVSLFNELSEETRMWVTLLSGAKFRHVEWALAGNQDSYDEWRYAEEREERLEFTRSEVMIGIMEAALLILRTKPDRLDEASSD